MIEFGFLFHYTNFMCVRQKYLARKLTLDEVGLKQSLDGIFLTSLKWSEVIGSLGGQYYDPSSALLYCHIDLMLADETFQT